MTLYPFFIQNGDCHCLPLQAILDYAPMSMNKESYTCVIKKDLDVHINTSCESYKDNRTNYLERSENDLCSIWYKVGDFSVMLKPNHTFLYIFV